METLKIIYLIAVIAFITSSPFWLLLLAKFIVYQKEKRNGKRVPEFCVECPYWNRALKNSEYGFCKKSKRKLPTHKNKKCIFI